MSLAIFLEPRVVFVALKRLPINKGFHTWIHSGNSMGMNCLNRLGKANLVLSTLNLSILH